MKPIKMTGQIYNDQTGRFPITSSRGNKYIMVVYDYDSNVILTEPLKSHSKNELHRAYTKIHTYLTDRGLKPVLQKLDNEAPGKHKAFKHDNDVTFQLVPPHQHWRNAAKRAITTWKDHFIATLATTDSNLLLHLWCCLINQATTTLNLLCPSQMNPCLYCWKPNSTVLSIITKLPLHHLAQKLSSSKNQQHTAPGIPMVFTVGIWDAPPNTIVVTKSTSLQQPPNKLQTP
jgi:hypothetical protein